MATTTSNRFSARFASVAIAAAVAALAAAGVDGERAEACGGDFWSIADLTTFDPSVLGDPTEGLYYDPFEASFGDGCGDCLRRAMVADWQGYLGKAVTAADWQQVLLRASPAELAALARRATGKARGVPLAYDRSSIWRAPKDRLAGALAVVQLARQLEPYASFATYDDNGNPRKLQQPPAALVAAARAGMRSRDRFLAQRYAFLALRAVFYQRAWAAAIALYDRHPAAFAAPSADLAWRARHYVAGALARSGQRARANLELARIHAGYPPLAALAAQEFEPMEDKDWRASLKLARTVRERTELWRLVGLKKDGLVAAQEIVKLDPKSDLVGLLVVRELARAESRATERYGKPEARQIAAQKKAYAALEQLALGLLARGGDRPWLMELVAGHVAAKRGDITAARARLGRAVALRPGDAKVASQARASLAMALVESWQLTPAYETELATAMAAIDPTFGRYDTLRDDVRGKLAKRYLAAGRPVDAEFLHPGAVSTWHDRRFLEAMIARTTRTATPFERFVLAGSFTRPALERELAMRDVLDGRFAAAAARYRTGAPASDKLGTDPFVIHIQDCHDCDHAAYANAPWTHASLVARLAELERKARAGGEPGAEAALALGNALYNLTWHGNARVVLAPTHQATADATAALRWYKRAYDLTRNRERKAKAAFLAAKAELGNLIAAQQDHSDAGYPEALPIPKTWFPIVARYKTTRYYREVLRECGHFARWITGRTP